MRGLVYSLFVLAGLALILAIVAKYTQGVEGIPQKAGMIAGIGPGGYLKACGLILLIGANLALLELLKKK